MPRQNLPFDQRIKKIRRQHRRLNAGYTLQLDDNNLIQPRPRSVGVRFPWRALWLVALIALGFKAFLMAQMDAPTYAARLADLAAGNPVERAGAWMMRPDPVTTRLAALFPVVDG